MKSKLLVFPLVWMLSAILVSCSIEESSQGITGSVYVTLVDSANAPIAGATITVDGFEIAQHTPATVSGLSLGVHLISALYPGYLRVEQTVQVAFNDTVVAELATSVAPPAVIELTGAPDSTMLLLNDIPSGITPPVTISIGVGTYRVSMYLAGRATDLPARWLPTLTLGDTFRIPAAFTSVLTGSQPENLAPVFTLASDRDDSALYRLADYRGNVLLLTFFYSDCAPCAAEMPYIQNVYEDPQYAGRIQFFGIDPQDSYFTFKQFRNIRHPELGLTFPLLYGLQQGVKEDYDVIPFPTNVFIDQTGRIRFREASMDEDLLRNRVETLLAEGGQ
jgi:peroxiredoxin